MRWSRSPASLEHVPALAPSGLAGRYLHDPEFARAFYGAHPDDSEALRRLAETLSARAYPRDRLAAILRRQNARWGLSEETARQIDALEEGALCVFTGQQVGLLGGPLYTVYKALTAIVRAQWLSEMLDTPVVPMFWLAADDHDLDEINHVVLPNEAGHPRMWRYPFASNPGARVSRQHLGDDIAEWTERALAALDGPGWNDVAEALREAYCPGRSWADAFGALMARWLGRFGLVLVTPDDADLKRLMAPIFAAEIVDPHVSLRAVAEREAAIVRAGYRPQVGRAARATFFFVDDERGQRRRIDLADGGFACAGEEETRSPKELERLLEDAPECFSAGVLLRPVTADAVFPTIAHVMGFGEIAYMAQAKGIYDRHGVPMPCVMRRAGFTVVLPEVARLIEREHLALEDAFQPVERWVGLISQKRLREWLGPALDACRREMDEAYARLTTAVEEVLPGTWNAVASARAKTQGLMNRLERTLAREVRRRQGAQKETLRKIGDAVYPLGRPQERTYPPISYLARYGVEWFDALAEVTAAHGAIHMALWPEG